MIIKVVHHYAKDDVDCSGDYSSIELYFDGEFIREWGDYYHDKGLSKLEGYLQAWADMMNMEFEELDEIITHEHIADGEY